MKRHEFGCAGESMARDILTREGYRILRERFRFARGEIDLIGMDGSILAFVEVKARRRSNYGTPAEAVDRHKRSHIIGAAKFYLAVNQIQDQQCRFDVLSIFADERGDLIRYELIRDAFQVKGGNYV